MGVSSKALGSFFSNSFVDLRFLKESLWNIFPPLGNTMESFNSQWDTHTMVAFLACPVDKTLSLLKAWDIHRNFICPYNLAEDLIEKAIRNICACKGTWVA